MVYEYFCEKCQLAKEVVKPVCDYDKGETCDSCGEIMQKKLFVPYLTGCNDSKEYNYSIGEWCTRQDMRKIAKERGLVEVGTEKPETIEKHANKIKEEKQKSWNYL